MLQRTLGNSIALTLYTLQFLGALLFAIPAWFVVRSIVRRYTLKRTSEQSILLYWVWLVDDALLFASTSSLRAALWDGRGHWRLVADKLVARIWAEAMRTGYQDVHAPNARLPCCCGSCAGGDIASAVRPAYRRAGATPGSNQRIAAHGSREFDQRAEPADFLRSP